MFVCAIFTVLVPVAHPTQRYASCCSRTLDSPASVAVAVILVAVVTAVVLSVTDVVLRQAPPIRTLVQDPWVTFTMHLVAEVSAVVDTVTDVSLRYAHSIVSTVELPDWIAQQFVSSLKSLQSSNPSQSFRSKMQRPFPHLNCVLSSHTQLVSSLRSFGQSTLPSQKSLLRIQRVVSGHLYSVDGSQKHIDSSLLSPQSSVPSQRADLGTHRPVD